MKLSSLSSLLNSWHLSKQYHYYCLNDLPEQQRQIYPFIKSKRRKKPQYRQFSRRRSKFGNINMKQYVWCWERYTWYFAPNLSLYNGHKKHGNKRDIVLQNSYCLGCYLVYTQKFSKFYILELFEYSFQQNDMSISQIFICVLIHIYIYMCICIYYLYMFTYVYCITIQSNANYDRNN